jgi:tetratricopeptide (TPR) repeat protein
LSKKGSDDPRILSCQKDLERYKDAGEYGKALKVLDELDALESVTYDNLVERGEIFAEQKKYEEALRIFKQAIMLDNNQIGAWLNAGFIYMNLEQFEDGLHAYDKVIDLKFETPALWGLRGVCLQELGNHEQAAISFKKVVEVDPTDVGGWEFMGKSLLELERYSEAAKAFAKAYKLDNANHDTLFFQYMSLIRAKEIRKAMDLVKKHAATLSENKLYLGMQAMTFSMLGQDTEALSAWQQVIDKGDCSSFIHLGKVGSLIALQRWDEADTALEGALNHCPHSKSPQGFGTNQIIEKLLNVKQDSVFWQQAAHLLISHFAEHKLLSSLAAGLAQSVVHVMQKTVSDEIAKIWLEVWVKSSEGYPEMELSLRLLDTASKYRSEKDQRILMELPIEERKIFEEIVEKAEKQGK